MGGATGKSMGDAESMGCEAFVTQLVRRSHFKNISSRGDPKIGLLSLPSGSLGLEGHSLLAEGMGEADALRVQAHGGIGDIQRLGVAFFAAGQVHLISDDGKA